jgi:N-dimethylarginine dimethylaminohydrolase
MVHTRATADTPRLSSLPPLDTPRRVLMTTPAHFEVAYVINPHMEGNAGTVDQAEAHRQWAALRDRYRDLGIDVAEVDGVYGLADMVFCANQTLPFTRPGGTRGVVLSRMYAEQRKGEVPHYAEFFAGQGYEVHRLDDDLAGTFEGMGDALWHPNRRLLWGGYGFRTDRNVYDRLAGFLDTEVCALNLDDPDFYHLDTCLAPLDEKTALVFPGAFDEDGLSLIRHFYEVVIEAPEDEARGLFACNAHCPDGRHVIIQRGCTVTNGRLREAGFEPVEVDTGEFLKSGGSVFCMKLMFW